MDAHRPNIAALGFVSDLKNQTKRQTNRTVGNTATEVQCSHDRANYVAEFQQKETGDKVWSEVWLFFGQSQEILAIPRLKKKYWPKYD